MKKTFLLITIIFALFFQLFLTNISQTSAYQIQELEDKSIKGDFVLGPGKSEFWLNPAETAKKELYITNRLGKTMGFNIQIEDFTGSDDPESTVVFLGEEKSPYTLKDYIKPEISEFVLNNGQKMILPVEISVPADAEPGGRYAAVLVSATPLAIESQTGEEIKSGVSVISRLASLFFVRVKGEAQEEGILEDFKLSGKSFFEKGPVSFELFYKNSGNVHLIPYGIIEIFNIFGKKVDELEIDPYFTMPKSLRFREVKWNKKWGFGRYIALASINRGYRDLIDKKILGFWIIPWNIVLLGAVSLAIIVLLIWLIRRLAKNQFKN